MVTIAAAHSADGSAPTSQSVVIFALAPLQCLSYSVARIAFSSAESAGGCEQLSGRKSREPLSPHGLCGIHVAATGPTSHGSACSIPPNWSGSPLIR
jgi:hypothetical protein